MKSYQFVIEDREYTVKVESFESDQAMVRVDGTLYRVKIPARAARPTREKATPREVPARPKPDVSPGPPVPQGPPAVGGQGGAVVAPMPGLITAVLVNPGDTVRAGQTLLRMEAMKMENEIPSPTDGTIKEVKVSEGNEVQENTLLIVIVGSEESGA